MTLIAQCESAAISLPDSNQPVVNPSVSYCVSFTIDPTVTGHPIGVCMDLEHSWQGDLSIRVLACGNTLMLLTRPGNPGGSCNAGSPFGSAAGINGTFCFGDTGPNPDNTLPPGGGNYGLSPDRCNVNTVDSFAELADSCGDDPYTFTICITDHAFANIGFASNITPVFPNPPICGCTDTGASNYDPSATVDDGSCEYNDCEINFSLNSTPATCGENNGTIQIANLNGGSGNYLINWSNGTNNVTFLTGLSGGTYSVTVIDSSDPDCTSVQTVTLSSTPGYTVQPTIQNTSCGNNNGSVVITTTSGVGAFTYQWSPPLSGNQSTQNNLPPGSYSVTITNPTTSCTQEVSFEILPSINPLIQSNVISTSCNLPNGSISINVINGSGNYSYQWSNPALVGPNNFDLSPGIYTVTITDANTNCQIIETFEIEESIELIIETTFGPTSCGLSNGYISVEVIQGIGPYTYNWYGEGPTNATQLTDLQPGTYFLELIDDASGCLEYFAFEIFPSYPFEVTSNTVPTQCNVDNGSIQIIPVDGSGNYSYYWFHIGSISGPLQSELPAGVYAIEVTDLVTFCTSYIELEVEESLPLQVNADVESTTCGLDNGTISITTQNGSGAYTYQWSPSWMNGSEVQDLAAGLYTVTVTDDLLGCESEMSIELADSEPLSAELIISNTTCGLSNGVLQVSHSNGMGPFSYNWSHQPNLQSNTAENLSSSIGYTATVTDNSDQCTIVLNGSPEASEGLSIEALINPLICGPNDASIQVAIEGGSGSYNFNWGIDSLQDLSIINNLSAGTYPLTITDIETTCTLDTSFVVQPLDYFSVNCEVVLNESILGENDGVANLTLFFGMSPFQIFIDSEGMTDTLEIEERNLTIENLSPGSYDLYLIDSQGCETFCSFQVLPGPCGLEASFAEVIHPSCFGHTDGRLEVVTNGYEIVSYTWDGPISISSEPFAENLIAGEYQLTITDLLDCQVELSTILIEPAALQIQCETIQNETFKGDHDGIISVGFSGGTEPYLIELYLEGLMLDGAVSLSASDIQFSQLTPGIYTIVLTDSNQCEATCEIQIIEGPCELNVNAQIEPLSCYQGSDATITLSLSGVKGNYNINWGPGITANQVEGLVASELSPSIYTITVVDDESCSQDVTIEILNPDPLVITCQAIHETEALLGDGAINIDISGFNIPITATLTGPLTQTITINDPADLRFDQLIPGIYQVVIVDGNGCTANCQSIINPAACELELSLANLEHVKCFNGSEGLIEVTTINGTGEVTYFWSGPLSYSGTEALKENLSSGSYIIQAIDVRGCSDELRVTINQPTALNVQGDSENPKCGENNGSITIDVSGGMSTYDFLWQDGEQSLTRRNLSAGLYSITVSDANNCSNEMDFELNMESSPEILSTSLQNVSCFGLSDGMLSLEIGQTNGMISIEWSTGYQGTSIAQLSAGNYQVTITDENNCSIEESYQIEEPENLDISIDIVIPECGKDHGFISTAVNGGTAPYEYSGDLGTGGPNFDQISPGIYTINIIDAQGCLESIEFEMEERFVPESNAGTDQSITCLHPTAEIFAPINIPADYRFEWRKIDSDSFLSNSEKRLIITTPGSYEFSVFHPTNGCIGRDTVTVFNDVNEITFVDIEHQEPSCHGLTDGFINILEIEGGLEPYIISFNQIDSDSQTFGQLGPGNYQIEISEQGGCKWPIMIYEFTEPELLTVTVPPSILVERGDQVLIEPVINEPERVTLVSWTGSQTFCNPCEELDLTFIASNDELLTVRVSDERGCTALASTQVYVKFKRNIYIPNAFTPNNDQTNDFFFVYGDEWLAAIKDILIFDRWGTMVYQGSDLKPDEVSKGWDGRFRGEPMSPGTYVYTVKVVFTDGHEDVLYGEVILLK